MNQPIKAALRDAFEAPHPEKKEEFFLKMRPRDISMTKMVLMQTSYIRNSVWVFSVLIFIVAIAGMRYSPDRTMKLLESITPFAAAIGVLETYRSHDHKMSELEQATRFSLRSIIFARMLMVGTVNMAVMLLSSAVISAEFGTPIVYIGSRILIPYLLTMSLGLHIERSAFGRNNTYASLAVAGVIAILILSADLTVIFSRLAEGWILVIAGLLLALTGWELLKTLQFTEAYA